MATRKGKTTSESISKIKTSDIGLGINQDIKMEIDKNDVISYHVAVLEEKLEEDRENLHSRKKVLETKNSEISKIISAESKSVIEKEYLSKLGAVEKTLKELGMSGCETSLGNIQTSTNGISAEATIRISDTSGYGTTKEMRLPTIKATKTIQKALDDQKSLLSEISKLVREIGEISQKLNNMSKLERKAKAMVVKSILAGNGNTGSGLLAIENATGTISDK